jgi:aminoglycoside phosphotransferase (APT) family kinase protein
MSSATWEPKAVVEGHATNLAYMRFQFDKKLREFDEHGGDRDLRRRIERYVSERGDELLTAPAQPAFCHNDCYYGNVLVLPEQDGWRVSGLVDFENVLAGDPLLDLAKTHCYAERRSEQTLAALADGHGTLPDHWRQALDLYVLYHWIELWDWFASIGMTDPLAGLSSDISQLVAAS